MRLLSVRSSVGHGYIVAKRCEIGPRLILITNKTYVKKTYQFTTVCKDDVIYQSSKTAKIIWVTLGAMHNAYGVLTS